MKHPSRIAISEFTYELPPEKIAVYPLEQRDDSKLLVFKQGRISEDKFRHLPGVLSEGSLLVFNNTKVIQARLHFFNARQQAIEIFCLEPGGPVREVSLAMNSRGGVRWNCLVGHLKRWKEGALLLEKEGLRLEARLAERRQGDVTVDFSWEPKELTFAEVLERTGQLPIPPYLKRDSERLDAQRYQTIYAQEQGSVAAPTAGLHFTDAVFEALKQRSIGSVSVTLHVGAGTFKPVKSETLAGHEMHAEWIEVSAEAIRRLMERQLQAIVAVGTTSLRTLETLYWMGVKAHINPDSDLAALEIKQWDAYDLPNEMTSRQALEGLLHWMEQHGLNKLLCRTQILIAPPYQLKIAAGLITNFHQPQSTLLLLIAAVVGERWKEIYAYALEHDFRFLSYGDSSLLLK